MKEQKWTNPSEDELRTLEAELRSEEHDAPFDQVDEADLASSETASAQDSLRQYLREIGRVPLLSAAQERTLAQRIALGRAELKKRPAQRNAQIVGRGADAERRLIEANLRLVVSVAKRYVDRDFSLEDSIQEGNLGLMRAVERYDHTRGYKFSTYATWWIRQAIVRGIADKARQIRLPVHMIETINRFKRTTRTLQQKLGREPRIEEIAEAMQITPERAHDIVQYAQKTVSLDAPIGESEDDGRLGDFIEDQALAAPADLATQLLLRELITEVIAGLTEREQQVLRLRFGLDDGRPHTLEEVGKAFHVSRERIRQLETRALNKLRADPRRHILKDYLD